jgi:hypothetical protein
VKRSVARLIEFHDLKHCHLQLGIDLKTRETQELTEVVEIQEDLDEEQQISEEVLSLVAVNRLS